MKQGILRLGGVGTAVCVHVTASGGTLGVGGQGICSQPHCQLAKATSLILVLDECELTNCGYLCQRKGGLGVAKNKRNVFSVLLFLVATRNRTIHQLGPSKDSPVLMVKISWLMKTNVGSDGFAFSLSDLWR